MHALRPRLTPTRWVPGGPTAPRGPCGLGAAGCSRGAPTAAPPHTRPRRPAPPPSAWPDNAPDGSGADGGGDGDAAADIEAARARLTASAAGPRPLSGDELTQLVRDKWGGRSYEARIVKRQGKLFVHIMWRYLEQTSFAMSADEYALQMDAVASLVSEWGAADAVRAGITGAPRPPAITQGGGARAVSIPLEVKGEGRAGEWF